MARLKASEKDKLRKERTRTSKRKDNLPQPTLSEMEEIFIYLDDPESETSSTDSNAHKEDETKLQLSLYIYREIADKRNRLKEVEKERAEIKRELKALKEQLRSRITSGA